MKIVIAGAGPAGLYTGWRLVEAGHAVTVVEREPRVGGLAASIQRGANHYGYGTHHLHHPDPKRIEPFQTLMGSSLKELERRLAIKFMGRFYPYPLKTRNLVAGMPLLLTLSAGASLAKAMLTARWRKVKPRNAEEAITALYGRKLYEIMFRDYTTRFWGMPPSRISSTFVDKRMPGISAVERMKRLLNKAGIIPTASLGKTVTIGSGKMYTTDQGTGAVFEAMAEVIRDKGGAVLTSTELTALERKGDAVHTVRCHGADGDRSLPCDLLVSTIPINHLVQRLLPTPPAAVLDAADRLGFRALLVMGLLVRPRKSLDTLFTYFPDRSFHRLAEVTDLSARIHPEGCSILLAEVTCEVNDAIWEDPAPVGRRVVEDLAAEGLIRKDQILETHFFRTPEAYPKYTLGFEGDLEILRDHLGTCGNLVTTGRQGAFQFTPMVPTMEMAWRQTEGAMNRLAKKDLIMER